MFSINHGYILYLRNEHLLDWQHDDKRNKIADHQVTINQFPSSNFNIDFKFIEGMNILISLSPSKVLSRSLSPKHYSNSSTLLARILGSITGNNRVNGLPSIQINNLKSYHISYQKQVKGAQTRG